MFVKAQIRCPFDIYSGTLSKSWSKRSKFMLDWSRSKEGERNRNLRRPVPARKGLRPGEPVSSVSLSGTWGGRVDREA